MIIQEQIRIGEKDFVKTYSDKLLFIERNGERYISAIDLPDAMLAYTETNESIYKGIDIEEVPLEHRAEVIKQRLACGEM